MGVVDVAGFKWEEVDSVVQGGEVRIVSAGRFVGCDLLCNGDDSIANSF